MLLIGCGNSDSEVIQENFKQGVQEMELKLLENAPPSRIYPQSQFKIIVDVRNKLAYDIAEATLTLIGFNDRYVQITPNPVEGQYLDQLQGRSLSSPEGERKFIEFDGRADELFLNAERQTETFFLKLAYKSSLDFTDTVCINPQVYVVYDAGCQVEQQKSYSGQGGPVAVTKIEEIMLPGPHADVEFRVSVANKGRGEAGTVQLVDAKLGKDPLKCDFLDSGLDTSKTTFSAEKKEKILICRKERLESTRSYKTPLSLRFIYDYKQSEQKTLNIVK